MSNFLNDFTAGISRLQQLSRDMSELDLREAILEQRELLVRAKEEILRLQEELAAQRALNETANFFREKLADLTEIDGFKFDTTDEHARGLPYCPACEINFEKLFRLKKRNDYYSECPNCSVEFNVGKDGNVHGKPPPVQVSHPVGGLV